MDPRKTRKQVKEFLDSFRAMQGAGRQAADQAGIPTDLLHRFVQSGSPRKDPSGPRADRNDTFQAVSDLLDMGGQVSGGGAASKIIRV